MPQNRKMFITDMNGHLLEESDGIFYNFLIFYFNVYLCLLIIMNVLKTKLDTELEKIEETTEIITGEEDCGSITTTDGVLDPEAIEVIDEAGEQVKLNY